jgi:glycosyltransferase involved in cell wall biosynthesis
VAISGAVAESLVVKSRIIPNPYRSDVFRQRVGHSRDRELIFVGRLVSDKGCDLLMDALEILGSRGITPSLTVVGTGAEEAMLRTWSRKSVPDERIMFTGPLSGDGLATMLCRHRFLVVPSRWKEPFGIVALEGIACGCIVVGSSGGGLPEAIGPCGMLFANGDAASLASCLESLLADASVAEHLRENAPAHLALHAPARVAADYLHVFMEILPPSNKPHDP